MLCSLHCIIRQPPNIMTQNLSPNGCRISGCWISGCRISGSQNRQVFLYVTAWCNWFQPKESWLAASGWQNPTMEVTPRPWRLGPDTTPPVKLSHSMGQSLGQFRTSLLLLIYLIFIDWSATQWAGTWGCNKQINQLLCLISFELDVFISVSYILYLIQLIEECKMSYMKRVSRLIWRNEQFPMMHVKCKYWCIVNIMNIINIVTGSQILPSQMCLLCGANVTGTMIKSEDLSWRKGWRVWPPQRLRASSRSEPVLRDK